MRVLSIDAWGDKSDGYQWNNWVSAGEISKDDFEKLKTDKDFAVWFYENGLTNTADMRKIIIDDDQYNIIICEKKTRRPLFAIEYGPEYYEVKP